MTPTEADKRSKDKLANIYTDFTHYAYAIKQGSGKRWSHR